MLYILSVMYALMPTSVCGGASECERHTVVAPLVRPYRVGPLCALAFCFGSHLCLSYQHFGGPYTRMLSSSSRLTAPVGVRTLVASAIADPLVVLFPPGAIHDEIVRVSG